MCPSGPFKVVALLLVCSCPALGSPACDADREALHWLERMSRSMREFSYQGVVTYQRGNSLQPLRISHYVTDGRETALLTSLSGRAGTVVRRGHPQDRVHPGGQLTRISAGHGADPCGLARHYRLQFRHTSREAGRDARWLQVSPRDRYRYGYQLALDTETGLLLRSRMLTGDGKVLEHFQFADLQIGRTAVPVATNIMHLITHTKEVAPSERRGPPWRVTWVPEGFVATGPGRGVGFSDGLAAFSVYLERRRQGLEPGEGRARRGGTTAYTRGVHLAGRPLLITVIGEIPIDTARKVADSITWVDSSDAH